MINFRKHSLLSAGIGLVLGVNVNAQEIEKTTFQTSDMVSKVIELNSITINNPLSNINEKYIVDSKKGHELDSLEYQKIIQKRQTENIDIDKVEGLLNIMYIYMQQGRDVSYEESQLMKIYSKNYHSEDINFLLGQFLINTNGSSEYIRKYFLQALKNGNKHREDIENIYFSKIFGYIKEDSTRLNEPFIAGLIIDFIPYIRKDYIVNSGLKDSIVDNLLLIKEYKHNLNIIDKNNSILLSADFIEIQVMDLYTKNQNNIDVNFIMGEYMLSHKLFPTKMRECFLKALKGGNKYSEIIHEIFLSKIIEIIKTDKNSISNEDYGETITTFLPYIKDDLIKIGVVDVKK